MPETSVRCSVFWKSIAKSEYESNIEYPASSIEDEDEHEHPISEH